MSVFKHDTLRSPQLKKKKRKVATFRLAVVFVIFALLIVGAVLLSRLDAIEIQNIETRGNTLVTEAELRGVVDEATAGSYLKLFSRRNVFLYPKEEMQKEILTRFPVLSTAEVNFKDMQTIAISVTERSPSALLCVLVESSQPFTDQCYFMDSSGFIYSHAPEFKGSVYFKYYGLVEGEPIGQNFIKHEDYTRLSRFFEDMKARGITPLYIHVKKDGDVESYLRGGGRILISLRDDLEATFINLDAILEENLGGSRPEASIEYIDLRYGNKIFYKLR